MSWRWIVRRIWRSQILRRAWEGGVLVWVLGGRDKERDLGEAGMGLGM